MAYTQNYFSCMLHSTFSSFPDLAMNILSVLLEDTIKNLHTADSTLKDKVDKKKEWVPALQHTFKYCGRR